MSAKGRKSIIFCWLNFRESFLLSFLVCKERGRGEEWLLIIPIPTWSRSERRTKRKQSSKWFKILIIFWVKSWFTPHNFTLSSEILGVWLRCLVAGVEWMGRALGWIFIIAWMATTNYVWKCLNAPINANGIIAFVLFGGGRAGVSKPRHGIMTVIRI